MVPPRRENIAEPSISFSDAEDEASGVRPRASSVRQIRILLIEPDAGAREAFAVRARELGVPLLIASSPVTALALRAQSAIDLVACVFPLRGADAMVRTLQRERFPVLIVTSEPARAIGTFGLGVPLLLAPFELDALLEHSLELSR